MKKIISLVLLLTLILCNTMVQAAETPSLRFLKTDLSNAEFEQNTVLSLKLNESFLLLDELAKSEDAKSTTNYVDVVKFFESLFDSTINITEKVETTNGGKTKSTESHIKSDVSIAINNNLEGNFKINNSVWSEIDLSDENQLSFDVIMTHPFAAKYITVDSELLEKNGAYDDEIWEVYKMLFDAEKLAELDEKVIESIKNNATVTGNSRKVVIKFNDIGLKLYIADVMSMLFPEEIFEELDMDVAKDVLAQIPVFGKEALTMQYTLDTKGRVTKEQITLNVNCNIYDFMVALAGDVPSEETGIVREKCQLNFTITSESNFKYGSVTIKRPELTEENSIDIFEFEDPYYYDTPVEDEYYYDDDYWMYSSVYVDIDQNCIVDNKIEFVCLRNLMEEMGYSVFYEDGKIFGKTDNPYTTYNSLLFTVGGNDVSTDIVNVQLDVPIFVIDGVSYISVKDCIKLTGYMDGKYSSYDFFSNYGYMEFVTLEYYNDYFAE